MSETETPASEIGPAPGETGEPDNGETPESTPDEPVLGEDPAEEASETQEPTPEATSPEPPAEGEPRDFVVIEVYHYSGVTAAEVQAAVDEANSHYESPHFAIVSDTLVGAPHPVRVGEIAEHFGAN